MAKRKKKDEKPKRDKVLEYKGWKAGDRCYTVFSGDTKPSLCDIKEFHPKDNIAPSVSVSDVVTGKQRVTPFMSIADDAKSAKKLLPKWNKFYKKWEKNKLKLMQEKREAEQILQEEERQSLEKGEADDCE